MATTNALKRTGGPVLIVDDDPAIVHLVAIILRLNGYTTHFCHDGGAAVKAFQEVQPRLVLLDVRMPVIDGVEVCRQIRAVSDVPIIMMTVLDDQKDVAKALEAGADDYLRKPFGAEEFAARVNAVLRRFGDGAVGTEVLECCSLILDVGRHVVRDEGDELALSATEFALLAYLMRHRDRVLTHAQVLETLWGTSYVAARHILRVTMSRLRQKLHPAARVWLQTVPGVGYRFHCTGQAAQEPA
jgi:DNA-binding response OmpR family regulator